MSQYGAPAGGPALSWRVNPALPVVKIVAAALLAGTGLVVGRAEPSQWTLALLAAAGLLGWAARDLLAPVRLTGDESGLTVVTGFAGHRRLAWSQIERVRVERRSRLGMGSELLEIDTGERLHFLSAYDLGAAPADVADALAALRPGHVTPAAGSSVRRGTHQDQGEQ